MDLDTILRLAREAGFGFPADHDLSESTLRLERFAALVAAHEREQIIRLCGEHWDKAGTVDRIVAAIRSRT